MTPASGRRCSRTALAHLGCVSAFTLVAAIMPATVTVAQGFREGLSAYNLHQYATALADWRPLAAKGSADAQAAIGYMYLTGRGVRQDYRKAAQYYAPAAARGQPDAQYFLGMMYLRGRGVKQDYARAHVLCELAMTLGQPRALLCGEEAISHVDKRQLETDYREVDDLYTKFQRHSDTRH